MRLLAVQSGSFIAAMIDGSNQKPRQTHWRGEHHTASGLLFARNRCAISHVEMDAHATLGRSRDDAAEGGVAA
jgi:hypothetical protein